MRIDSLKPMLARLARELPEGHVYEPKWDGFRCLAERDGMRVELRSRHGRPLERYFPEVVTALAGLDPERWVLDGELLVVMDGYFDFAALMQRLHPAASRVRELAVRTPAMYMAFDLVAVGAEDLSQTPFAERRRRLEEVVGAAAPPLFLTPATSDREVAERWLAEFAGGGLDGVVAKRGDLRYEPGARAMIKVKHEQTADCVVAGLRPVLDDEPAVASLLLGLYDQAGTLEHIGVVSSFRKEARVALARELAPLAAPLEHHPWERGFLSAGGPMGRLRGAAGRWMPGMDLDWVPLAPERVCEVSYTQVDGHRLRHPARFKRWRPDREPASCGVEQLDVAAPSAGQVLGSA